MQLRGALHRSFLLSRLFSFSSPWDASPRFLGIFPFFLRRRSSCRVCYGARRGGERPPVRFIFPHHRHSRRPDVFLPGTCSLGPAFAFVRSLPGPFACALGPSFAAGSGVGTYPPHRQRPRPSRLFHGRSVDFDASR